MVFDMSDYLLAFDLLVQILVQFGVAFFSYKVYTFNKARKKLLFVTAAFILMGLRRIITVVIYFEQWPTPESLLLVDSLVIPVIVSVFLAMGFWSMLKQFESFEIIEQRAAAKTKKFFDSSMKTVKRDESENPPKK